MIRLISLNKLVLFCVVLIFSTNVIAQKSSISGQVKSEDIAVPFATVFLEGTTIGTTTDTSGYYVIKSIDPGSYTLMVSSVGYEKGMQTITLKENENAVLNFKILPTSTDLNEVVVTGVSKATLIRENPVSISSISPKQIEQATESNIIDVLVKNTPGLYAVKTGPNISKPFIRGLGYNRVLTLYDGIRQEDQQWGDEHGIEVDAYNIERAEVIKGPASLMFGSGAIAGVVNFFPYVPKNKDGKLHGKFTSEYQSNNNLIGNGARLDYANKHFLFAVRGSYRLAKNYRNAIDERVYLSNFTEKNASALLGYETKNGYTHINFTFYGNSQGIPDGSRDSLTRHFTKQIYEGELDTINNRPLVSDNELNSFNIPALSQYIQHFRVYSRSNYEVGKGDDIDIRFAFQQNIRREYNHPSEAKQAGMNVRLNTLNYGIRYSTEKVLGLETSIGTNGMVQNNTNLDATDFPIPDYNLLGGGIYLHSKWKKDKWVISGGIRYDIQQINWNDFYVRADPSTGFDEQVTFPDTSNANLQYPAFEKLYQGLSASLGMTFQATEHISFKANIGRAFRAPNITEIASNGLDPGAHIIYKGNKSFNPEFSLQEDVGASARFPNFSADVSVFNNTIQNYIYLTLLVDAHGNSVKDAQGNRTYQYQQAKAQLYGAEVWFSFHPKKLKGFRFDNSMSVVYGFNRSSIYKGEGINGNYLPLIPPLKIVSSISKKIKFSGKLFSTLSPKIEFENVASQNRYLGLNNTETATPSYSLFNIGVVAGINYSKSKTLQIMLQINNLLNNAYQSNLSRLKYFEYYSQSPNGRFGIYNMGRNISLKIVVPFQ